MNDKLRSRLQINEISASYGDALALQKISLDVNEGEIVGLVGPNGAGKSTLIKVLSGVLNPTGGTATIEGQQIISLGPIERARKIAVVPQARHLGGAFSVHQAVFAIFPVHLVLARQVLLFS